MPTLASLEHDVRTHTAEQAVAHARQRVRELERALAPFARAAQVLYELPGAALTDDRDTAMVVPVGVLRAALRAYGGAGVQE
jgi:hypothetical protein